jgi:hypothetical protein
MIPPALLRDAYLHDGFCPSKLGFLAILLGGGVLHKPDVDTALRDGGDWDGLGVVRRKGDISHLVGNMGTELSSLLKIDKQEVPLSYWKVGSRNPQECYLSIRFTCPTKQYSFRKHSTRLRMRIGKLCVSQGGQRTARSGP